MLIYFFRFIKKIILASILIYSFDMFAVSLNFVIPLNIVNILLVSLFGIPSMICLIFFSLAF